MMQCEALKTADLVCLPTHYEINGDMNGLLHLFVLYVVLYVLAVCLQLPFKEHVIYV